jgi:hypothetical protein
MRHQLGVVEGPAWLDAAFVLTGQPCCVDMVADSRVAAARFAAGVPPGDLGAARLGAVAGAGHGPGLLPADGNRGQPSGPDAEARCAQWLLRHAQHADNGTMRVTLHQRKRLIAAQLGIAPETFSRVLRHLREHGLIAGTGNVLNLPHPTALQVVAGG